MIVYRTINRSNDSKDSSKDVPHSSSPTENVLFLHMGNAFSNSRENI